MKLDDLTNVVLDYGIAYAHATSRDDETRNWKNCNEVLANYRATILAEAADRAMMWWYEGDKVMTEMNQINSLRAAIMEAAHD